MLISMFLHNLLMFISFTVIDTRAHLPPYYNLTETTHNQNMSMSLSWRLSRLWGERSHDRDRSY